VHNEVVALQEGIEVGQPDANKTGYLHQVQDFVERARRQIRPSAQGKCSFHVAVCRQAGSGMRKGSWKKRELSKKSAPVHYRVLLRSG
jgi:hypothetical protein